MKVIYYSYLHIGVEGLRALCSYDVEHQTWRGDHDQVRYLCARSDKTWAF